MRQCFQFLLQFFLLSDDQTAFSQLFELETDIIFFLPVLVGLFRYNPKFSLQRLVALVFFTVQDQQDFIFRHYIDHFQLEAIIAQ